MCLLSSIIPSDKSNCRGKQSKGSTRYEQSQKTIQSGQCPQDLSTRNRDGPKSHYR